MKDKKKKKVIVSQKLYPSQINELSICCFVIKADILDEFEEFIQNNGGRIISSVSCSGVSRNGLINAIEGYNKKNDHFDIPNIALGWSRDEKYVGFKEIYLI